MFQILFDGGLICLGRWSRRFGVAPSPLDLELEALRDAVRARGVRVTVTHGARAAIAREGGDSLREYIREHLRAPLEAMIDHAEVQPSQRVFIEWDGGIKLVTRKRP